MFYSRTPPYAFRIPRPQNPAPIKSMFLGTRNSVAAAMYDMRITRAANGTTGSYAAVRPATSTPHNTPVRAPGLCGTHS